MKRTNFTYHQFQRSHRIWLFVAFDIHFCFTFVTNYRSISISSLILLERYQMFYRKCRLFNTVAFFDDYIRFHLRHSTANKWLNTRFQLVRQTLHVNFRTFTWLVSACVLLHVKLEAPLDNINNRYQASTVRWKRFFKSTIQKASRAW